LNENEKRNASTSQHSEFEIIFKSSNQVDIKLDKGSHTFVFDCVYGSESTQVRAQQMLLFFLSFLFFISLLLLSNFSSGLTIQQREVYEYAAKPCIECVVYFLSFSVLFFFAEEPIISFLSVMFWKATTQQYLLMVKTY
jgi:hypothetical protein